MSFWYRAAIAGAVILISVVVAKIIDSRISRRDLAPGSATRYRVVRRVLMTTIVFVGVLSALLVIPRVSKVAGGVLASSAVVGLVIGFASQRTIGNAVAGIMIAFSQPLRLGDLVSVDGTEGTVEEIALTYTFIRTKNGARFVIPNEKLASDTIVNYSIRSLEKVAEVTVQIPVTQDLEAVVSALREETSAEVYVSSLDGGNAVVTLRTQVPSQADAERVAHDLLLSAHKRLRADGVFA
jgi:small-conductance mechanosensitive channel